LSIDLILHTTAMLYWLLSYCLDISVVQELNYTLLWLVYPEVNV